MKTSLSLAATAAVLAVLSVAACQSSDSDSGSTTQGAGGSASAGKAGSATAGSGTAGTGTAGTGTAGTGTAGTGTAGTGTAGTGTAGTGGGSCDTNLPTLHPPQGAAGMGGAKPHGIYCPFSNNGGSGPKYCDAMKDKCCEGAVKGDLSVCTPLADACAMNFDAIECTDAPADCGGTKKCCAKGMFAVNPDPMCANFASKFKGTYCADSCAADESEVCTANDQCTGGKTCLPFKARGGEYGICK